MLNDDLEVYGSCDLEKPKIPPRSRLYHLEPIGIGTPYVETCPIHKTPLVCHCHHCTQELPLWLSCTYGDKFILFK